MVNPLTHDLTIKFSWNPNDKSTGGKEKSKKEFNPNIIETITRLADVVSSEDDFIENVSNENYKKLLVIGEKNRIELKLKEFNLLDEVLKNRIILIATRKLFGSTQGIEKVNIEDIIKLCNNNIGNKFLMPNKNLKVLIQNKKINFIKID